MCAYYSPRLPRDAVLRHTSIKTCPFILNEQSSWTTGLRVATGNRGYDLLGEDPAADELELRMGGDFYDVQLKVPSLER